MKSFKDLSIDHQSEILSIQRYIPVDIKQLAKNLDIKIIEQVIDRDIYGYLSFDERDQQFTIFLNSNISKNDITNRFTIAHEIAHFLLHNEYIREKGSIDRSIPNRFDDLKEVEANQLALLILLPYKQIRNCVDKGITSITALSNIFGVSIDAMRIRVDI